MSELFRLRHRFGSYANVGVAILFTLALIAPILINAQASAYTLLGDREIRMSTSEGGATGASYLVDFEVPDTDDIGGIVVAFCVESPIIGDEDCAIPAGFDLTGASVTDADAGLVDVSSFSAAFSDVSSGGTGQNTLTFSDATPVNPGSAGQNVRFTIAGVDNPTDTNGTFYARIMVYETETTANSYNLTTVNPNQAGGIALTTAQLITIEARVQERITFCVYTSAVNYSSCATVNADDPVALGDTNGVLDSLDPSIAKSAKFNITTNASTGATIRMAGNTLETGAFSIDAIGDTAVASDPGTEQFGLCMYTDADSLDPATLNPLAPYNDADCVNTTDGQGPTNAAGATFAFHTDTGVLYGSPIALKNAGAFSTGILAFIGNISDTTEPGIYTTTLDFIATGRY